jgi:alpha-1,2-glucosyltransferase
MLYLWPYMLFFSFPVAVPTVLSSVLGGGKTWSLKISELPRLWTILVLSTLAALVVHYNTIVHPFTLADNRHYVFYVFRILTRHRYIKYLVTPIYIICGWIMIRTLGGSKATHQQAKPPKDGRTVLQDPIEPLEPSADNCHTSFVLAWLGTTALCLVTAPLVEPRYFIIPWVVWRFHVPLYTPKEANPDMGTPKKVPKSVKSDWWKTLLQPEIWLWVETLWFCLINCVTGYIFLNWTFEWPQELGQKQRFMW